MRGTLAAAILIAANSGCTAGTPSCTDGVDRGLKSTGTCGPAVTVTVKSGSTCSPSAFTGFNSELAGFPLATNDASPTTELVALADGGHEIRQCLLKAIDAGFVVSCKVCGYPKTPEMRPCTSGECEASLVP